MGQLPARSVGLGGRPVPGDILGAETAPAVLAAAADAVRARIVAAARRAGRDPDDVRIVAVTKGFGPEAVQHAAAAGLFDCGENRVVEAVAKAERAPPGIVWHLIGHLQTNKAAQAAALFHRVHTVDSRRVADALDVAAGRLGKPLAVLVQVNTSGETAKSGVHAAAAADLVAYVAARQYLTAEGLMTIPAYTPDPEGARPFFQILRRLRDEVTAMTGLSLPELSMGMSHDLEVAVEEGATWVRVGTALFGPRG